MNYLTIDGNEYRIIYDSVGECTLVYYDTGSAFLFVTKLRHLEDEGVGELKAKIREYLRGQGRDNK